VVGEAQRARMRMRLFLDEQPDVALVDIQLPDGSGLELAEALRGEPLAL